MQRALFVSDLHLAAPEDARSVLFLDFLASLEGGRNASHLFLLGDVFDLWLGEHRCFVERWRGIVGEIERLVREGVAVHYFEGNHDLYLGDFWAERLGVHVHPGPWYGELAGWTVRLEHGDQMDPEDRGYLFLRWFLRTPAVSGLVRRLPGRVVAGIGERASATSRAYTSETKTLSSERARRTIRAHAERACAERPFDLIVSGHVHVRDDQMLEHAGRRFRSINLGSWLDRPCCLVLDESGPRLLELPDDRAAVEESPGEPTRDD
jgi:UDP-2,3-diacylglucosamine hydrolase